MDNAIYENAAELAKLFLSKNPVRFSTPDDEIARLISEFKNRFSAEKLAEIPDEKLLQTLFLTADGNNDSLCYHLEFNKKMKRAFGSISGGSSYKYGLFQRQEDGRWVTGASKDSKVISETEALTLGKKIRDFLVNGCKIIAQTELNTVEDYEALNDKFNALMGAFASYAWIQKYFFLIFQDKFVGWYVTDWLSHMLYGFGIEPSSKYYGMNGQLSIIARKMDMSTPHFQDICYAMFGGVKKFYRLGSSDSSAHYADKWKSEGLVGIGWAKTGDLLEYLVNGKFDKDKVAAALVQEYNADNRTASRKAGELRSFFETTKDSVFVVMDGFELKGFVDDLSPYYYDEKESMAHRKNGTWRLAFSATDRLPEEEGTQTSCYEIRKTANLLYLYSKYYNYQNSEEIDIPAREDVQPPEEEMEEYTKEDFLADVFMSDAQYETLKNLLRHKKNIILQGAPGVGKTYLAKRFAYSLLGKKDEKSIEVIQFHQSYSYEDFIMGYKPKDIGFELKPGVFFSFCKKAEAEPNKEFFFIIDEINRGNLSKIFGELMMLIEGDKRGSENKIKLAYTDKPFFIPENVYLIGMMNTADRSLAMMDYALRRRFSFYDVEPAFEKPAFKNHLLTKLGINEAVATKVVERFTTLNKKIADEDTSGLGKGFCIGHSYFCVRPIEGQTAEDWYSEIIKYEIAPLLYEYWWDDKDKAEDCIKDLTKA